ncbi:tail fiber assembly protein [Pantoea rwandensis]|nr:MULTISPECIES: tail fiber assembly protein [unclassified Pantoea]MCA1179948.1 tail fiber assembly protein [Pantoea sp. alder69]MCA1268438.1 tail fiber assembly protein [Pantoea sp. alder81]
MIKLNQLDSKGLYVVDYVTDGDDRPANWTVDLVGDGFYKARYKDGVKDKSTGEWVGGTWTEEGGPSDEENLLTATSIISELKAEANAATYPLSLKLLAGRKLSSDESSRLNAWIDYTDSLDNIDLTKYPDIKLPTKPE